MSQVQMFRLLIQSYTQGRNESFEEKKITYIYMAHQVFCLLL